MKRTWLKSSAGRGAKEKRSSRPGRRLVCDLDSVARSTSSSRSTVGVLPSALLGEGAELAQGGSALPGTSGLRTLPIDSTTAWLECVISSGRPTDPRRDSQSCCRLG